MTPRGSNYILFSDVHLGADLVQHVRPWTMARLKQVARIDRDLAAMLDHYREHADPERPWTLVIAGDLVDFIGISIAPGSDEALETTLTDEELVHGLGSASDHAAQKMRAVAARHSMVFDRLARFVAAGHSLVLVRGNHDLDFHWEPARQAFIEAIWARFLERGGDASRREAFESRVEFYPWFYYVEGLLYVEHGHQFDAMCNYADLLAPLSPADPRRLSWSFSDWLLRIVARPTPGLTAEGHDGNGFSFYLRMAASLGVMGALRLGSRYLQAIAAGIRAGRARLTDAGKLIRAEHERGVADLARRMRLSREKLVALAELWPTPVTRGVVSVLRSVFADRIVVFALALVLSVIAPAVGAPWWLSVSLSAALVLGATGYSVGSAPHRAADVDPNSAMRRAALRIKSLLPARFVVMGHTHEPLLERLDAESTYINLGNWSLDEIDAPEQDAPRTHLVLELIDGQTRAELRAWRSGVGPVLFEAGAG
ncbi:MAG: hypothetical protein GXP55_16465 [Deltaproteobacteria bacterium]|nr:hypothetical protein [Deltaproteobacteria bacterium]